MRVTASEYVRFFHTIGNLKKLPRTGWVMEKVKDPESVAEHCYRLALMAMVLVPKLGKFLDVDKLVRMALLHDIGEAMTGGDLVFMRKGIVDIGVRDKKERKEREGIVKMFRRVGEGDTQVVLYNELTERMTPESRIFWQLDVLEMAEQALEYEEQEKKALDEFFTSAEVEIKHPLLMDMFSRIVKARKQNKKL